MSYFPIFIELDEKLCLIVGGGRVALRKTRTLLEFGAAIKVVALSFVNEFEGLKDQIKQIEREFKEEDLEGARLVIAATDRPDLNFEIGELCKKKGIPVNLSNGKEHSSFLFPACVKRSSVVIGISTGGKSPALAKDIRERVEALIDGSYGEAAETLGDIREIIKRAGLNEEQKRELFHELAARLVDQEEDGGNICGVQDV